LQIEQFLKKTGQTYKDFAIKVAVSPVTVFRYIKRTRTPDRETLRKIYTETDGAVTPNDFFVDDLMPEEEQKKSLLDRIRRIGW